MNHDAVIDAAGAWTPDTVHIVPGAVKFLADLLRETDTRLLVVGGAGSLFVDIPAVQKAFEMEGIRMTGKQCHRLTSCIAKNVISIPAVI